MLHQNGQKLMKIEQQSKTTIDLNVIYSKVDVDFFFFFGVLDFDYFWDMYSKAMKLITIRNACHFQSILHYQIEEHEKIYVWWKMQNIYQGFDEV